MSFILLLITACGTEVIEEIPSPEWGTPSAVPTDSGRVTLHRLNNTELQHSVQQLLRTDLDLKDTLPADGVGAGFNNNAEAQVFSPLHLESYGLVFDTWIADAMRPPIVSTRTRYETEDDAWSGGGLASGIGTYPFDPGVALWHGASHGTLIQIPHSGPYTLRALACHETYGGGGPTAPLVVRVHGEDIAEWDISQKCKTPELVDAEIHLEAGATEIEIWSSGPHLAVDWLEFEGPLDADGALPPGRDKFYTCDPEFETRENLPCIRAILGTFTEEAWRRPVTHQETDRILDIYHHARSGGSDVHEAIRYGMKRALLSPWFLFRVEVPNDPEQARSQPLNAHELAARLSYFLWSGPPDTALRAAADDGTLTEPAVLEEHTRRMLADPKAEALVFGFGAQWLGLEELHKSTPDTGTYPTFTEPLREAMAVEMQDHIRRALLGEDSMMSLFTSDTRWVTPLLAEHYGMSVTEPGYMQVPTRLGGGLLTSAGLLTATSSTTRTSPVRRGFWVASEVFCEEPPPPPDAVEQEIVDTVEGDSVPEQLAAHRANPACAGCHNQLDPIGLALEQFNGIGLFRTHYLNGDPIETGSELVGVGYIEDGIALGRAISEQPKTSRCIVQKAVTYALGRKTNGQDWQYIEPIETAFREADHRFSELVVQIVHSDVFRTHRGAQP